MKKLERVTFLMPTAEARHLKHAAIEAGCSTSAMLRNYLRPLLHGEQHHQNHGERAAPSRTEEGK
jgi:hypothetical protein